ncbi:Arc family DNA-binding protein [Marivita sp.]|uniref:Arc family DNA-binding protein n=1 Tax=Marivita sp. TaxID=2003365 RepID=UPI0026022114|nr:Arc family DNA-binding protein [Marivita sp.]
MPKFQTVPFGLRMPDEIKEWAKRRAKEEDRSMNSMIVRILKERMEQESEAA